MAQKRRETKKQKMQRILCGALAAFLAFGMLLTAILAG